jgi:multiple antibiotic resistance protein
MGIPMIAGPGAIATTLLMVTRTETASDLLIILSAITLVLLMTLGFLLVAIPLLRFAGARTEAVLTRILGVILAALAVQFVIDGVRGGVG